MVTVKFTGALFIQIIHVWTCSSYVLDKSHACIKGLASYPAYFLNTGRYLTWQVAD